MEINFIYDLYKKQIKYRELLRQEAIKQVKMNMPKPTKRFVEARDMIEKINKTKNKLIKRSISSHL